MAKQKSYPLLIALVISAMFAIRAFNGEYNYIDYGLFIKNLSALNGLVNESIDGHFQPILLLVGLLLSPFDIGNIVIALIIFNFLYCISILIYVQNVFGSRSMMVLSIYYAFWYTFINEIHFDYLAILPQLYFFNEVSKGNIKKAIIAIWLTFLLKEAYILCGLFYNLYILIFEKNLSKNDKKFVILSFAFTLTFAIVLYLFWYKSNPYISVNSASYSSTGSLLILVASSLASFGFIPLLSLRPLFVLIPVIIVIAVSSNANYSSYVEHYSTFFIAPFTYAFYLGNNLLTIKHVLYERCAWLLIIFSHFLFAPSPVSRHFLFSKSSYFYYTKYHLERNYPELRNSFPLLLSTYQPSRILVQNSVMALETLSDITVEPLSPMIMPGDMVIIDTSRDLYIQDVRCLGIDSPCFNITFRELLSLLKNSGDKIFEYNQLSVWLVK